MKYSNINKVLRERLQELRNRKFLPKGYATVIGEKIGCTTNKVYHTFSGNNGDLRIIEGLVEIAEKERNITGAIERAVVEFSGIDIVKEVKRIREQNLLPKNYSQIIAKETGYSENYIRCVLSEKNTNESIAKKIIEVVQASKELELLERLNRLLK